MQYLPIVAIIISILAFLVSLLSYRRKSKIRIYGLFQITSSIYCDDKYISKIILENKKDKAVSIFGIFLKIYPNYYIELSLFEESPLMIKPFETFSQEYGPIQYYGINLDRIKLDNLFKNKKGKRAHKMRIILATSEGKYVVRNNINYWFAISEIFKNHFTGYIIPSVVMYKDKYVGSNVKYILSIKHNENEQTLHIHGNEYQYSHGNFLNFSEESLSSKESLIIFLNNLKKQNKFPCESFEVIESSELKNEPQKTIIAPETNWFEYNIIGRLLTIKDNIKAKIENQRLNKKNA